MTKTAKYMIMEKYVINCKIIQKSCLYIDKLLDNIYFRSVGEVDNSFYKRRVRESIDEYERGKSNKNRWNTSGASQKFG